jgi:hypothetical protein
MPRHLLGVKGVFTLTTSTLLMSTTARLRGRRVHLERRATASKAVRASLVSLAGLVGGPVTNQSGEEVGRIVDVVARLYGSEPYPPATGLVVRIGRRRAFLPAGTVEKVHAGRVALRSARLDLREYERRPGEVLLGLFLRISDGSIGSWRADTRWGWGPHVFERGVRCLPWMPHTTTCGAGSVGRLWMPSTSSTTRNRWSAPAGAWST